ncbi:MAG: HAMP domain-containing histidine kinase [Bdellovibrionales bacterium]|nr:HAMP domain-containing histidine kinase [Bdellovibrionales bacterium]
MKAHLNFFPRAFRLGLLWKLFTVFLLAGLAGALVIGAYFRWVFNPAYHSNSPAVQNLNQYADYLLKDMGEPPIPEKAKPLAQKLSLGIRISDSKSDWATDDGVPSWIDIESKSHFRHHATASDRGPVLVGRYQRFPFAIFERNGRKVFIMARVRTPMEDGSGFPIEAGVFLLVGLLLVFFGLFWSVRRMLRPLVVLNDAVHQAGQGQLGIRVPVTGQDEIGRLGNSFNEMSLNLKRTLESRDQLLRDVSHELRTPLTRIRLATELLKSGSERDSIQEDLRELDTLIGRVLDYSKFDASKAQSPVIVQSDDAVREALKSFSATEKAKVQLKVTSVSFTFQGEVFWLARALRNVIENALKFSPEDRAVELEVFSEGGQVVFRIVDQGEGISAEDQKKIFDPFFRSEPSRSKKIDGIGLGLSLTKRVIETGGGKIQIQSEKGQGTQVRIDFPKA